MARKKKAKKATVKPKASGTKRGATEEVESEPPSKKVKDNSQVADKSSEAVSDAEDSITVTPNDDENTPA